MSSEHSQQMVEFARYLAVEGGRMALAMWGKASVEWKSDRSIVTEADKAVEAFCREAIRKRFPRHQMLGEEGTRTIENMNGPTWIVDPIDGTSSFNTCLPVWGPSIGFFEDRLPVAGAIYLPVLDDLYAATHDGPAFHGDRQIRVNPSAALNEESLLLISSQFHQVAENRFPGKARALGSTAANFCLVARGCAVAMVQEAAHIWDVAAGWLILERAGGQVRYLDGRAADVRVAMERGDMDGFFIGSHPDHFGAVKATVEAR